jgi:hypothetical protein
MKPAAIPARPTMTIPTALSWFPSLFADALALALVPAVEAEVLVEEGDVLVLLELLLEADSEVDFAKSYQHNSIFRTYRRQWK